MTDAEYTRWRRHEAPGIPDCKFCPGVRSVAMRLCSMHYMRVQITGSPNLVYRWRGFNPDGTRHYVLVEADTPKLFAQRGVCTVCGLDAYNSGLCGLHYERKRNNGSPHLVKLRGPKDANGKYTYRLVEAA